MSSLPPDGPGVDQLLDRADTAWHADRREEAIALYREALSASPENPRVLNILGNRLLSSGDADTAVALLRRAVAVDPGAPPLWLNLSFALRAIGDSKGELDALDGALNLDPYFVIALVHKAQWFEREQHMSDAVRAYRSLLHASPPPEELPAAVRRVLEHAHSVVADADQRAVSAITAELGEEAGKSRRFQHCLDILAGRRKIYVQQPAGIHFPYLPAIPFFERTAFPWIETLEAAAPAIAAEFEATYRDGMTGIPYVRIAAGQPTNQWDTLNGSLDWEALFLWKDGRPNPALLEVCPVAAATLAGLPMLDIQDRAPTAMYSILQPRTHIPPHHGVTNIRSVVHLPLVVPGACRFRVGAEVREWRVGEAWVFDDTIEHEAWNDSDEPRVVLIFDVWNPLLHEEERRLLRSTSAILKQFGEAGAAGF